MVNLFFVFLSALLIFTAGCGDHSSSTAPAKPVTPDNEIADCTLFQWADATLAELRQSQGQVNRMNSDEQTRWVLLAPAILTAIQNSPHSEMVGTLQSATEQNVFVQIVNWFVDSEGHLRFAPAYTKPKNCK